MIATLATDKNSFKKNTGGNVGVVVGTLGGEQAGMGTWGRSPEWTPGPSSRRRMMGSFSYIHGNVTTPEPGPVYSRRLLPSLPSLARLLDRSPARTPATTILSVLRFLLLRAAATKIAGKGWASSSVVAAAEAAAGGYEYAEDFFPPKDWLCYCQQSTFKLFVWSSSLESICRRSSDPSFSTLLPVLVQVLFFSFLLSASFSAPHSAYRSLFLRFLFQADTCCVCSTRHAGMAECLFWSTVLLVGENFAE